MPSPGCGCLARKSRTSFSLSLAISAICCVHCVGSGNFGAPVSDSFIFRPCTPILPGPASARDRAGGWPGRPSARRSKRSIFRAVYMEQVLVRNKFGLVILGVTLIGVSGCSSVPNAINPISWYRDATGLSKNDDLGKGENEENLAAGGNQPYPNLASVPSPPDAQLSGIDRDRLKKSLVADRTNAQYSADNLRAGDVASTVPPPAPPARNTPAAPTALTSSGTVSSPPSPAPRTPVETASAPPPPAAA